jgi:C-terminal processing protease CtpA/Prc
MAACAALATIIAPLPAALAQNEPQAQSSESAAIEEDFFAVPVETRMSADIDRMIALLGAPNYAEREVASEGLIEIGTPAFRRLRDVYKDTDDLEVKLRIERIVHTAYLDHEVYSRHAFLGISLAPYAPRADRAIDLPPGAVGVMISNVIPNTAAQKAGLQREDVILAVDKRPNKGIGTEAVNIFSQGIAARRPGTHMLLTVVRPDGVHEFDITLGRCPRERVQQTRIREKYDAASQRFAEWWAKNFR